MDGSAGASRVGTAAAAPSTPTTATTTPLTDTQLLRLSLRNAVASAAAGKATIAANNYALVVKIIFRKCFLLEELVLLALAMGYEARQSSTAAVAPHPPPEHDRPLSPAPTHADPDAPRVDPLANVGMLLPPGLDEDDYDEERTYYEQKEQREQHGRAGRAHAPVPSSSSSATLRGGTGSGSSGAASPASPSSPRAADDTTPGYDAATARWLACLLAKVHPDALPTATLEKICKVSLTATAAAAAASASTGATRFTAGSNPAVPPGALPRGVSSAATTTGAWPCASSPVLTRAAESTQSFAGLSGAGSPTTVSRLLPHLKASPTASPTMTSPASNATAAPNAASPVPAASLSLLFATLLWDVACALWNQGFIEDAHHWLSVMDVRRLWKLYRDVCRADTHPRTGSTHTRSGHLVASADGRITPTTSAAAASPLFASAEPVEDAVGSAERACALSWPAVLAETRAADAPPPTRSPPRITDFDDADGAATAASRAGAMTSASVRPAMPRARSGITLSAFAAHSEPLPMTGSAAPTSTTTVTAAPCVEDAAWRDEAALEDADAVDESGEARLSSAATPAGPVADSASSDTTPTTAASSSGEALAVFVRRLARRTSALRDLCALMIACETAEDVFYVMFALNGARVTQQVKHEQATLSAAAAMQRPPPPPPAAPAGRAGSVGGGTGGSSTSTTTTTTGGLAELLIVANLLVEFFITKRAQRIMMEEDQLRSTTTPIKQQQQQQQQLQRRRTDRAIRRACDEVVCAFTNGRCLTLYALESYGIPPPYDGDSNTAAAQLLAPELPYVLVSNVLSSTLNYATLYGLSKVYHGVMGCRGYDAAAAEYHHSHPRVGIQGEAGANANAAAATATATVLTHPNRTRRATDEEKERRRTWTMHALPGRRGTPATSWPAAAQPRSHSQQQQQPPVSQGVVGELLGFVREAATGWRHLVHGSDPASAADSTSSTSNSHNNSGATVPPPSHTLHHHHDVRPSFSLGAAPTPLDAPSSSRTSEGASRGSPPALGGGGGGGYAERLAAARRERQSTRSPALTSPTTSSLPPTDAAQPPLQGGSPVGPRRGCELKTRGVGACELLLPSTAHAPASSDDGSAAAAAAAATSVNVKATATTAASLNSSLAADERETAVSLLAEEAELTGPSTSSSPVDGEGRAGRCVSPTGTVLHTAAVQLQSRSPSEAMSLRLLTLLYRYPQLHTLEEVAASHVDLVTRELNKALHILQVAMRERFGDGWWLQWRARREGETQRYYARALADAQRGGNPLSSPPPSPTPTPGDTVPPFMMGTPAVQPDPSLLLTGATPRHPSSGKPPVAHRPTTTTTGAAAAAAAAMRVDTREPFDSVLPPSAPPPSSTAHEDAVLSGFWNTRTLCIPTDAALRERRQAMRENSTAATGAGAAAAAALASSTSATTAASVPTISVTTMHGDGAALDVDWDVPPAYTPEVSLDFSAFTTSSVETQENTRLLVEALQRRERADAEAESAGADHDRTAAAAADAPSTNAAAAAGRTNSDADGDAGSGPGVSILSRACRRLLHNELPLLLQYCPWRVIYSTRMHGISLSTLFANCRREGERHSRSGYLHSPASLSAAAALSDAKPMLLVVELPPSTTRHFAEDDAGVREAYDRAEQAAAASRALAAKHSTATASTTSGGGGAADAASDTSKGASPPQRWRPHRMFIGAFLSDLLRLESRRYYGTHDCFVFQLFVPGTAEGNEGVPAAGVAASASAAAPQLRVHRSSSRNTQYINCRTTSIVIGGGDGGGSSVYLDNTLLHGATSACATFASPPLSTWATAMLHSAAVGSTGTADELSSRQNSLSVLNVEVIVMDA